MIEKHLVSPLVLAVVGVATYHIAQKLTSAKVEPLLSLGLSFLTASAACLALLGAMKGKGSFETLALVSWTAPLLGLACVAIECGFLLAYRRGAPMNRVGLVVNVSAAIVLLALARFGFGEIVTSRTVVGIITCIVGLWMLL